MELSVSENRSKTGIAVELRGVGREFPGGVRALEKIDLQINAGEFLAILGPSGCGKSTLLRMIADLDKPTSGTIQAGPSEGLSLSKAGPGNRRAIAYVFQDAHLLPWRNVVRNVALPLELIGVPPMQRRQQALHAIEQVGLADAMNRYPAQLSGGMRMRVSLARALVTNPDLLLLDEPFAALDEITRQQLDEQLHQLWRARRMTVIFVTHSIMEATFLAQRAIVMTRRPGRVILDHALNLPAARSAELRTDPKFSLEMRSLFEALQSGEKQ